MKPTDKHETERERMPQELEKKERELRDEERWLAELAKDNERLRREMENF